jgi:Flp pilus assembly protein TadG
MGDVMSRTKSERGSALLEAAVTIPLLLLISVGIFDFGRAYQTWQIVTNAAREGARLAVVPNADLGLAQERVRQYMRSGQLTGVDAATVSVSPTTLWVNGTSVNATEVTIDYPFNFIALQPVARLVNRSSTAGHPVVMHASAVMRNEAQ